MRSNRYAARLRLLVAQQLLDAADSIAFLAQKTVDAPSEIDVSRAVIAAIASPLHRLQLRETRLPIAQDMLGNAQLLRQFADSEEGAGVFLSGNGQGQSFAMWSRMI